MDDRLSKAIDGITERILAGERLSESDVQEYLYMARDFALLYVARITVSGDEVSKARIRAFNALQNAVERYEENHRTEHEDTGYTVLFGVKPEADDSENNLVYCGSDPDTQDLN